jgi:ATP-dependent helicase STH1/SNF2
MQQPRMAAAALAPAGWGHGQAGRSAAMGQQPPGAPVSDAQLATLQEQLRQYGSIMHSHSQKMMQQPVPPPDPRYRCEELSLSELKVERERISRSHREAALQLLLADPDPSVQTQIRIKQLQLLPLQHQVRNELRMMFEGSHGPDAIRQWFEGKKRFQTEVERGLKRAARARADEIKRHTKITRGFFDDMFKHGERMRELVKKSRQSARRDRTKAEKWHNDKIRDDKKLEEKRRRERIQALRDNDEEKYLALLKSEKNERLNHLMKETEAHLQLLTEKMQMAAPEGLQSNGEGVDGQPRTAGQRFHQAAHAAKEQITEQPSILVGGDLKSYQIEGLNWTVSLFNNGLNGILADEMGLGKTIQTIALITHLMERKANPGPYLIVVPLSVLPNWRLELEKWAPSVKLVVFKGPDATRKRIFKEEMADFQFNVVLTTYEYIMKGKALLGKFLWQYIIIDEGHRIKNAESKLAVMLGHKYKSKNRLLLTGTPLQNNLSELWALLNFLLPQVFNSSASFEAWFNEPMAKLSATGGSEEESALNEEEKLIIVNRLHAILKPFMLRRMKKDVESQLPQKSEVVLKVELSGWQKLIYRQLKNEGLRSVDSEGRAVNKQMMNLMMQLRKACNHPYLFWGDLNFPNEALYRASGKFEMLDRMLPKLHKTGHKVLIFTQMTKILDLMEEFLTWRHWKYLRLDGTTRSEERGQVVDQFMDKDAGNWIFLLTTRAGGVGLNLQVADTVIIFDSDWNPQMDMQAMDRAHRIGQQSEVRVFRMITNTQIEEEIFSRAKAKKNVNEIVVRETNEDETDRQARLRKLLEEEKQEGSDDEESEESGAMSWDECNNMLARSEEELALFEKMDKELLERDEAEWNARQEDDPKPWPGRLMSDAELPTWMVSGAGSADTADSGTSNAAADSAAVQENLGPRKRERVSYKPVSDQEFNRMLLSESGAGSGAGKKTTKSAKKEVDPQMKKQLLGIWTVVANTSQTGLFDKLPTKRECVLPHWPTPLCSAVSPTFRRIPLLSLSAQPQFSMALSLA